MADDQFNAYCVDCMRNQATYFELKHGIFICEPCAVAHIQYFPFGKHYLKEIYTEHWDPNQLKILAVASNEEWFNILRSYRLETLHIGQKYKTIAAKWHKQNLYAKAHGLPFNKPKPATGHHQS